MLLEKQGNPYYLTGSEFKGIGGPHIGLQNAWPMSLLMQAHLRGDIACLVLSRCCTGVQQCLAMYETGNHEAVLRHVLDGVFLVCECSRLPNDVSTKVIAICDAAAYIRGGRTHSIHLITLLLTSSSLLLNSPSLQL